MVYCALNLQDKFFAFRLAIAYVFGGDSTSKWDTCGPHAILRCLGGGIVKLNELSTAVKARQAAGESISSKGVDVEANSYFSDVQLRYDKPDVPGKWCNTGGSIAYLNNESISQVMGKLFDSNTTG